MKRVPNQETKDFPAILDSLYDSCVLLRDQLIASIDMAAARKEMDSSAKADKADKAEEPEQDEVEKMLARIEQEEKEEQEQGAVCPEGSDNDEEEVADGEHPGPPATPLDQAVPSTLVTTTPSASHAPSGTPASAKPSEEVHKTEVAATGGSESVIEHVERVVRRRKEKMAKAALAAKKKARKGDNS